MRNDQPKQTRDRKAPLIFHIADWGTANRPMIITTGGESRPVTLHNGTSATLNRMSEYAGKVGADLEHFHLGFYGFLRLCDAVSIVQRRSSALSDMLPGWRTEFYDKKVSPEQVIAGLQKK